MKKTATKEKPRKALPTKTLPIAHGLNYWVLIVGYSKAQHTSMSAGRKNRAWLNVMKIHGVMAALARRHA
jgi:hypothetical protein